MYPGYPERSMQCTWSRQLRELLTEGTAFQVQLQNVAQSGGTPATASGNRVDTLWPHHSPGILNQWTNTGHGPRWESHPTATRTYKPIHKESIRLGVTAAFCSSPQILISVNVCLSGNERKQNSSYLGFLKFFGWSSTFIQKVQLLD